MIHLKVNKYLELQNTKIAKSNNTNSIKRWDFRKNSNYYGNHYKEKTQNANHCAPIYVNQYSARIWKTHSTPMEAKCWQLALKNLLYHISRGHLRIFQADQISAFILIPKACF